MPGVIMETFNVGGNAQESGIPDSRNGVSTLDPSAHMQAAGHGHCTNHTNGLVKGADAQKQSTQSYTGTMGLTGPVRPPELPHITQGFFPFSTLINRSVQQCWNDLSDLIAELAEHQVPFQSSDSAPGNSHGKNMGNQSQENLQKKLRILDFAHTRRAEFIKILVLSQWSRQAADVSRLIDIQSFIRLRHQAYLAALQWVGDMKRDLVQAQVGNPDLQTALEVLTTGKVVSMPTLGYNPLKPLTTKETHKRLLKINRIISVRLMLCDSVPLPFQTYRVHDGRVTFTVPDEFELDLSIGAEDEASQFFFVDIRFLFTPSSPIPKGRMFNELDMRINEILCNNGLAGCFEMLHGLVLTNKINTLFKQALDLGRGLWSDTLRVELLHRTLVLQYWALKPGPKSWLEIGIKGNRRNNENDGGGTPYIGLRWIRDGQQVNSEDINFGTGSLSMECILRSVIALHISHILSAVYQKLRKNKLFSTGALSLRGQLSRVEPGACRLDVQLTQSRHLRISIETMSGMSIMSATPTTLERFDGDRSSEKPIIDDIVSRVARLRCTSAIDEVESSARSLGFQTVNLRSLKLDVRRSFPANVIRFSFFHHRSWDRHWILAATSSMDGDNWWAVQLQPDMIPSSSFALGANTNNVSVPRSIQVVCSSFSPAQSQDTCVPFVNTGHGLFGMLTIQANARYLEDLQSVSFQPPPSQLTIEPNLRVPDIFMRYQPAKLPRALQIATPCGLSKKLFIKETIRLAFHGVNPQDKAAIVVAYGTLMMPPGIAAALVSRRDHSLVFQERGSNFAIRLLAPAGRSVIPDLVESLQRLECVLTILETLQRKKMQPQSLSLSHIAFLYGPCHQLSARIEIKLTTSFLQTVADPSHLASLEKPLFHVNLGIVFEHPNPHRRIQGPLTSILNNNTTTSGLDTVTELLSLTLPLMRALDLIMTNPSHKDLLRVQVTVRNAKTFQIHYPIHKVRFHLIAGQRLSRMVWILRNISGIQNMPNQDQLKSRLQENLYNSRGDGWRGLGNGAVASVEKVGNLLAELDKCLFGADDIRSLNGAHPQAKFASTKSTSAPLVKPPLAAMETEITQHRATATNDADIIMID